MWTELWLVKCQRSCKQYTSHVTFSHAVNTHLLLHITLHGSKNVLVRVISSAWSSTLCVCPFFDSLFLTLFLSVCFSYPFFFYLNLELNLFVHVTVIGVISHWRSLVPWPKTPLSQVMSPIRFGDLHYSETTEIFFQGQSSDTIVFVLVWHGTRRRDHRQSALFTTVHSGARRTSGPETSLSLSWRKFVASSVLFRTHKNGRPVHELSSLSSCSREKPSREMENETIKMFLERQKRAISHWF